MAINKKAIFFTLISLLFILVVIAFFNPNADYYSYMSKVPTLKARLTKSNIFMHSLYEEVGMRSLKYSSRQAIMALTEYINLTGKPINLTTDFPSVILNGTIKDQPLENSNIYIMQGQTLTKILSAFQQLASSELNLDANMTVNSVYLFQDASTGYEEVGVALNLTTHLDSGVAVWDTTELITTTLDLSKFDDPYYLMNTHYRNRIEFSNMTNWSIATKPEVKSFIDDFKYTYEPKAPNFVMRLENISANSTCCGMESLINPVKLNFTDEYSLSYVDYCFFGQPHVPSCGYPLFSLHNFSDISSPVPHEKFYGFRLEIYHITKYNLNTS